jgi:hypothetical protein
MGRQQNRGAGGRLAPWISIPSKQQPLVSDRRGRPACCRGLEAEGIYEKKDNAKMTEVPIDQSTERASQVSDSIDRLVLELIIEKCKAGLAALERGEKLNRKDHEVANFYFWGVASHIMAPYLDNDFEDGLDQLFEMISGDPKLSQTLARLKALESESLSDRFERFEDHKADSCRA